MLCQKWSLCCLVRGGERTKHYLLASLKIVVIEIVPVLLQLTLCINTPGKCYCTYGWFSSGSCDSEGGWFGGRPPSVCF